MITAVDQALGLENVLRIAHVRLQLGRHLTGRLDGVRECLVPGLQDRVRGIPRIQLHGAVVGIHDRLHTVAYVIDEVLIHIHAASYRQRVADRVGPPQARRIGIGVAGRVTVDQPHDPAVDHRRVWIGVHPHPGRRCAPGSGGRGRTGSSSRSRSGWTAGCSARRTGRVHHAVQRRTHVDAPRCRCRCCCADRSGWCRRGSPVPVGRRSAHDGVGRGLLTEVHAGLIDLQLAHRRDVLAKNSGSPSAFARLS